MKQESKEKEVTELERELPAEPSEAPDYEPDYLAEGAMAEFVPEHLNVIGGQKRLESEDLAGRIEEHLLKVRKELIGSRQFSPQEIDNFLAAEYGGLMENGFTEEDIEQYNDYKLAIPYDLPADPKQMPLDDIKRIPKSPLSFWAMSAPERQRVRNSPEIYDYFSPDALDFGYADEQGTISALDVSEGLITDLKDIVRKNEGEPQAIAEGIFRRITAPVANPALYLTYKFVNGRMLNGGDLVFAAAKRANPSLQMMYDERGDEWVRDTRNFEQAMLDTLDYHPGGFIRGLGNIGEFVMSLKSFKGVTGLPGIGPKTSFLGRAHRMGQTFGGLSMLEGIEQSLLNPEEVGGREVLESFAGGYLGGVAWETAAGGITRTKAYKVSRKAALKYWQKAIDYPAAKIKGLSDASLAGRFRDVVGEHLVPFYKKPGTYRGRFLRTQGDIARRYAETSKLLAEFNKITNALDEGEKTGLMAKVRTVWQGKASIDTIPKELHGWYMQAKEFSIQSSMEQAKYLHSIGKHALARSYERNAGTFLPRLFEYYEQPEILRQLGGKPQVKGERWKVRRDKWIVWEGKGVRGKYDTLDDAAAAIEQRATNLYQSKRDALTRQIDDLWAEARNPERTRKALDITGEIQKLTKKRASLASNHRSQMETLGRKLDETLNAFLLPPEQLPPDMKAGFTFAGKKFSLKPPLSPEELQKLGEITDIRYLVARGLTDGYADMQNHKFLAYAAQKWGRNVPEDLSAKQAAEWLETVGYSRVPNVERYGALAGKGLPKNMANDIVRRYQEPKGLANRLMQAYLGVWKEAKVAWSPPTHGRNICGNLMFSDFADTAIWDTANLPYYKAAIKGAMSKDADYMQLIKYNAIGTEFFKDAISPLALEVGKINDTQSLMKAFIKHGTAARSKVRQFYIMEDQVFKLASYKKYLAEGMTPIKAAAKINTWYPNYRLLSPITARAAGHPFGAPFLAFTDQAVKIAGRGMREHPLKMAKWAALPGLMTEFSGFYLGMSPAERDIIDTNRSYFEPILPFRDNSGRAITWDLQWTYPLANDLSIESRNYGLRLPWALSSPIFSAAAQITTGVDPFMGRPLTDKDASLGRKILDHSKAAAGELLPVPSLLQYGPERLIKSAADEHNARESLERSILGVLAGINVRAPYIVRQRLMTDLRDEILGREKPDIKEICRKIVLYNETYRTEDQDRITMDGLESAVQNQILEDLGITEMKQKIKRMR